MQMISETHGGRRKAFGWQLVGKNIVIKNVENREHIYPVSEIFLTIQWLHEKFQMGWFPLANNVELLYRGEERPGLGMAILKWTPDDISHAQGSSYLGVVLEEVGVFEWNGERRGIQWRFKNVPETKTKLVEMIEDCETKTLS